MADEKCEKRIEELEKAIKRAEELGKKVEWLNGALIRSDFEEFRRLLAEVKDDVRNLDICLNSFDKLREEESP
ncbi:MAG: hypothetical protein ACUVQY_04185 [Thermoproteota archaeon]